MPGSTIACKAAVVVRPLSRREAGTDDSLKPVEGKENSHITFVDGKDLREYGTFDAVPQSACHLFETSVKHALLDGVIEHGYNATIMAYGQTGSGKTYTMGSGDGCTPGLIHLTVDSLFDRLPAGARASATFVQIYCEEVHDLQASEGEELLRVSLDERRNGGFVARGAKAIPCASAEAVVAALRAGVHNRKTGETRMNAHSSRSHAIFTLQLEIPTNGGAALCPKIHFVDLAGSERSKKADTAGRRLVEGNNINKSLMELGQVINARSKQAQATVRNSALTMLLHDSLGGNSQTLMVACVSPSSAEREETRSTLNYASRVRQITNRVTRVEEGGGGGASAHRPVVREAAKPSERELQELASLRCSILEAQLEKAKAEKEELQANVDSLRNELGLSASRELVIRGMLLAAEQRLRNREAALAVAEAQLEELKASNAEASDALGGARKELIEARTALAEARKEVEDARKQLEAYSGQCLQVTSSAMEDALEPSPTVVPAPFTPRRAAPNTPRGGLEAKGEALPDRSRTQIDNGRGSI
jgi:hypothetical protein